VCSSTHRETVARKSFATAKLYSKSTPDSPIPEALYASRRLDKIFTTVKILVGAKFLYDGEPVPRPKCFDGNILSRRRFLSIVPRPITSDGE
jgi:hypothetical protein